MNTNIDGTHCLLSALKTVAPGCRFGFAGSSEMFGATDETPQRETTKFRPRSCYGISKVTGSELTRYYREAYKMHAGSAIFFNHESPRRGIEFVTRKITSTVARIAAGKENKLKLGSLSPLRDWGYAPEYVEAMWLMLQQNEPGDYVILQASLIPWKNSSRSRSPSQASTGANMSRSIPPFTGLAKLMSFAATRQKRARD